GSVSSIEPCLNASRRVAAARSFGSFGRFAETSCTYLIESRHKARGLQRKKAREFAQRRSTNGTKPTHAQAARALWRCIPSSLSCVPEKKSSYLKNEHRHPPPQCMPV